MGLARAVGGVRRAPDDGGQPELGALVGVRDDVPDLQGALELLRGLGEGRGPLGLEAGLHVGRERLGQLNGVWRDVVFLERRSDRI